MATPNTDTDARDRVLIPSAESQKLLKEYMLRVLIEHKKFSNYQDKMEVIDVAYARYNAIRLDSNGMVVGQGVDAATTPVGVLNIPTTTPPVVVSQVDAMVAYLADVFLSGTPIFPVVSNPNNRAQAENLEVLIDDHATLSGMTRQLLLFLKDAVKYNFSAIEADWTSIDQYSITDAMLTPGKVALNKAATKLTKVTRHDPYNVIWDHNTNPGDVSCEGDYAGYIRIKSRPKLKRLLIQLGGEGYCFNTREALALSTSPNSVSTYYRKPPQISSYITSRKPEDGMNWMQYLGAVDTGSAGQGDNFEEVVLYARIIPRDFKLSVPSPSTPQVWKLRMINNSVIVEARRIISAYDYLPMLLGQPLEDGLGFQTQSVAEAAIPFQAAAAIMLNIRFNSARRAVSDRALYDSSLISSTDINAPVPAAKIPVKTNSLDGTKRISDAYFQIPFNAQGTETALQDGLLIASFAKQMAGLNNTQQGQFQKGNKSVEEFQTTMQGSDSILRMPALALEYQVFNPLKNIIKLNIFQYSADVKVTSQKTGNIHNIDINALRSEILAFKIADGYTPKSKLANTNGITTMMQLISSSPILQQAYGAKLPDMMAHLGQLMGIYGLEQYGTPPGQAAPAPVAPPMQQPQVAPPGQEVPQAPEAAPLP